NSVVRGIEKYDHVFYELNSSLHVYGRSDRFSSINPALFLRSEVSQLRRSTLGLVRLVVDGPCAFSKIPEQKRRRENSKHLFRPNITPGSVFMDDFELEFPEVLTEFNNVNYLSSNTLGEGEQKIFQEINNKRLENSLVITNDSDTYLYTLSCQHEVDVLIIDRESKYTLIKENLKNIYLKNICEDVDRMCADLCFLTLLIGSDYLKSRVPFDISSIWDTYLNLKNTSTFKESYITNKESVKINLDMLDQVFIVLLKNTSYVSELSTNKEHAKKYFDSLMWNFGLLKQSSSEVDYRYKVFDLQTSEINISSMIRALEKEPSPTFNATPPLSPHAHAVAVIPQYQNYLLHSQYHPIAEEYHRNMYADPANWYNNVLMMEQQINKLSK
ncbi:hypothetical protein AKO1_007698, partial [Acrasis kona]